MTKKEVDITDVDEDETRCRPFFGYRSEWADKLGKPQIFMVIYGIMNVLQGMLFTYFIGVMSSFEQHFQLKSEALGTVLSVGELIPVFVALIFSYLCGSGDRPRWMSFCMLMIALGCYIVTLPYFLFGIPDQEHHTGGSDLTNRSVNGLHYKKLCSLNVFESRIGSTDINDTKCEMDSTQENNSYAIGLYLLGYTIFNSGVVILYIVGTPYIDDNVEKKNSPMYLAVTCSMRSLGPLIGFILSYACLKFYVNPIEETNSSADDPHWIGAWWMGYIFMGNIGLIGAFLVCQFPIRLPSRHMTAALEMAVVTSDERKKSLAENNIVLEKTTISKIVDSLKDVLPSIRRIFTNVPFLLRMMSDLFAWLGLEVLVLFLPKYLEKQFHISQSAASIWTGVGLVAPSIVGTLATGFIIQHFLPTARQLILAIIGLKFFYALSLFVLMFLRCDDAVVLGTESLSTCGLSCNCKPLIYAPICGSDGRTYASPCLAGCSFGNFTTETWTYENCSCITDGLATANLCQYSCPQFKIYVAIMMISNFLPSVEIVGTLMYVLRCVLVQDKTIAMGIFSAVLSTFCFIPAPIISSAIVDSTCSIWSFTCDTEGACDVYDIDRLRVLLHIVPFALMGVGMCLDIGLWFKSKKISLFGEEEKVDR